jgi:hypothetical protein
MSNICRKRVKILRGPFRPISKDMLEYAEAKLPLRFS